MVILAMIVCLLAHQATAMWDVSYAYRRREIRPTEQHVHSFLEMLPLMEIRKNIKEQNQRKYKTHER
jgi:hypothetical protein